MKKNGYLLSWRDDEFCGRGWHLPGGLLRFQETLAERVQRSAIEELGTPVEFDPLPAHHYEIILPGQEDRGHVVAFLFKCTLPEDYSPDNEGLHPDSQGYLKWFKSCPANLLEIQEEYRRFF
jgi:colanic acid biosynthesis protein WcaH